MVYRNLKYFYFGVKKKKNTKKKNMKKIGGFSKTNISEMASAISIKFGMQGEVYAEHKICKFDINWLSSF